MNKEERVNELRQPLTMSMFLKREHLYQEQERQRQEAALFIERQAEAIRVLREALRKSTNGLECAKLSGSVPDDIRGIATAYIEQNNEVFDQTKEFGE